MCVYPVPQAPFCLSPAPFSAGTVYRTRRIPRLMSREPRPRVAWPLILAYWLCLALAVRWDALPCWLLAGLCAAAALWRALAG